MTVWYNSQCHTSWSQSFQVSPELYLLHSSHHRHGLPALDDFPQPPQLQSPSLPHSDRQHLPSTFSTLLFQLHLFPEAVLLNPVSDVFCFTYPFGPNTKEKHQQRCSSEFPPYFLYSKWYMWNLPCIYLWRWKLIFKPYLIYTKIATLIKLFICWRSLFLFRFFADQKKKKNCLKGLGICAYE